MVTSPGPLQGITEPLRSRMVEAGWSINRLADETLIPYTSLRRKLLEPESLTMGDLLRIAEALGVNPTDLLPADFTASAVA